MKQRQQVERKRAFVNDVLWPLLVSQCKTVREAKMFCKVAINDIQSTFNKGMTEPLSTLKLDEKFKDETGQGAEAYRAFAAAFKDTAINETLELLDGMPNAIDAGLQYEDRDRELSGLDFKDGTILPKTSKSFERLLAETALCNDFRQLGDGTWISYSVKIIPDTNSVYTGRGPTIRHALEDLNKTLCELK